MCAAKGDGRSALLEGRQEEILRRIEADGKISVRQICSSFGVSAVTARNDLDQLEQAGKLRRVHGGAVSCDRSISEAVASQRMLVNFAAKQRIAQKANELVQDGDSLVIDSGTTLFEFLKTLNNKKSLTIVTPDIEMAHYIDTKMPGADLIVFGGKVMKEHHYCCGSLARMVIGELFVDKAFMSTDSFSAEQGFATSFEAAAETKATTMRHARQRYMLMDASKFDRHAFVRFCGLEDLDYVVMDEDPNGAMAKEIARVQRQPQLVLA